MDERIDIVCPQCGDGCAACFDAGRAQLQPLLDLNTRVLRVIEAARDYCKVKLDHHDREQARLADELDAILNTTDLTALPTRYIVPHEFVEEGLTGLALAISRGEVVSRQDVIDTCTEYGVEVES